MEKVIDITAKREGFRRAGMTHSDQTQTYPLSRFSKTQLEQLQAEPMLVVAIRNKDDAANSGGDQLDGLKQKILQLEGDIQILVSQEVDAKNQIATLTSQLADEQAKNKSILDLHEDVRSEATQQLEDERQKTSELTTELDGERQKVADLTAQLEAATKKGK
jgi:dGTP triphosphohydrolase